MRRYWYLIISVVILNMIAVQGEIMLSQPNSVYNFGDILKINATLSADADSNDFLIMEIVCGGLNNNFYKVPVTLKTGEQKFFDAGLFLSKFYSLASEENCVITASYNGERAESQRFMLSDFILVKNSLESLNINPEKIAIAKGSAVKANGENAKGYVELNIPEKGINIVRSMENGEYNIEFSFPEATKSGDYNVEIKVYEKYNNEIVNFGNNNVTIHVNQVPTNIEIEVIENEQGLTPGNDLIYNIKITDQVGEIYLGNTKIEIFDPANNSVLQKLNSGEIESFKTETNFTPGIWKIKAEGFDLVSENVFNINSLEKIDFEMSNKKMKITNIGNVVYRKAIQISIGNYSEVKNLNLGIGESVYLSLSAPDGLYEVNINDGGDSKFSQKEVMLTGRTVGVNKNQLGFGVFSKYPVMWIFLIGVLGLFSYIMSRKIIKKSSYSYAPDKDAESDTKLKEKQEKRKEEMIKNFNAPEIEVGEAEHAIVLDGRKERASLVCIKVKNLDKLERNSHDTLNKVKEIIKEKRGTIYRTGNFIIGLFSSASTKTFENDRKAIDSAIEIEKELKEHNKKFKQRIEFGLCVNTGEIILKKEKDRLKFTSLGNTLPLAKRISDISNEEALLSEEFFKKVTSELKGQKENREDVSFYHILKINEREKNSQFISDFLKRNG
ncbi:hypothetical protein HYW76_05100 [Candidatus Pacearchaeota archaeon]|nr:hypothetical protein [Candidatus Pacearchaeota archaeon]